MERELRDYILIPFEIILTLVVLGVIAQFMSIGQSQIDRYQKEVDTTAIMEQYAIYNKYDGTELSGSDIMEAVFVHGGDDFVINVQYLNTSGATQRVALGGSTFGGSGTAINSWMYSNSGVWADVSIVITVSTVSGLGTYIDLSKDYKATLVTHNNGHIIGINFDMA